MGTFFPNAESTFNKELFHELFDHHPDAVFMIDTNGHILSYNHSVKLIFGYEDKDLKGEFSRYFTKECQLKRNRVFQLVLEGKAFSYQGEVLHRNGTQINIEFTYIPIVNYDKQVLGVYCIAKNITSYIRNQNELIKIQNSLENAQVAANIGSWDYDIIEDEAYWSNQTYKIFGIDKTEDFVPSFNNVLSYIHPEDQEHVRNIVEKSIENGHERYMTEYRILHRDGSIIYVNETADVILDENDTPVRLIGIIQNITKSKIAETRLSASEARFKNIYSNLEVGIWSFDVEKKEYLLLSPGIEDVTGYLPEDFKKMSWESIIHKDDAAAYSNIKTKLKRGESIQHRYRILDPAGNVRWLQDQTIPVLDSCGNLIRVDGIISNISEHQEYEEKIRHLAYHDYLTELPNRRWFEEKIESLITCIQDKKNQKFSIIYLNLDRFKNINDTLGITIADQLLQKFSERILNILNDSSSISRLSGDEFGIILWNFINLDEPVTLARKILDAMKEAFYIHDFEIFVTTSIGISTYPTDGKTKEVILRNADAALYLAKDKGKNNFQIYSSSLNIATYKAFSIESSLRNAIKNDEFILHFQPRVEAGTGKIVSAEALIRWNHPTWGLISPGEFIPIAEKSDLILDIGDWVLIKVCNYINEWKKRDAPLVPISINISAKRFLKNDWVINIIDFIEETHTDPRLLEFEITESTLIKHEEVVESAIDSLKKIGIRFALDDFGTGYSSLTYLNRFAIDTIKIDKSFIQKISKSDSDKIITKSIIFLARGLKMRVVAEGVETPEQLVFLQKLGCEEIQGFLFSKPVPEKEFQSLLKKETLKPSKYHSQSEAIANRRKYDRVSLPLPLRAEMTLTSIQGKKVSVGKSETLIEDIGLGGLRFLTNINLPVRPDLELQFDTRVMGQNVQLIGHIVWKQEISEVFQYGLQFFLNEKAKVSIAKMVKKLSVQLHNSSGLPDSAFTEENPITYIKNIK
nr:EAL domain-containing protein [Peribacillus deserti]